MREAARRYARDTPSISFHGLGVTEHVQGTEGVMALVNLALLTGNVGKPGTRREPAARPEQRAGRRAHGMRAVERSPGSRTSTRPRRASRRVWGAPVPRERGLRAARDDGRRAREARFKALWAMGYDVLLTNPERDVDARRSLGQLDLLVVQDIFMNETARELAHVVLPSACSFEKDGTFMNAERRVQRVRKAVDPPGRSAHGLGAALRRRARAGRGTGSRSRRPRRSGRRSAACGPRAAASRTRASRAAASSGRVRTRIHPGTTLLHADAFGAWSARDAARDRVRADARATSRRSTRSSSITGRSLYQFNAGTMTMRTQEPRAPPDGPARHVPRPTPRASASRRARTGARAQPPRSRRCCRSTSTTRVAPGEVFATFSDPATWLNALIGPHKDNVTETPDYKVTAVAIELAG